MLKQHAIIRQSAKHLAEAANSTVDALIDGRIEQEPAFTDRMLGRIEHAMSDYEIKGIRWTAKTLTDRSPTAQEKKYGADFMGVLEIDLVDYSVKKGFLSQAKLIEPEGRMKKSEFERMQGQCEDMLKLTPHSFVFLYSMRGITVVPAIAVVSSRVSNPHDLYSRTVSRFFEEHFASFIGDRNIHTANAQNLKALMDEYEARASFFLQATEA
jgi:hypothetical protein